MKLGLENRVALVMGASRGIGRAIAAALAREGARVAIASRSRERIDEAAAADRPGRRRRSSPTPPTSSGSRRLPGEVEAALGPIDILVANTGGPPFGGALDHDLDELGERLPLARPRRRGCSPRPSSPGCASAAGAGSSTSAPAPPASRSPASTSPTPTAWPRSASSRRSGRRGRRRRDHRQHRRHRPLRHRAARRRGGSLEAAEEAAQQPKSPPVASARPRSTATWSPSSAPSAPPTSPAP